MNLFFYNAIDGNFGDDLNPWLWSKLLGDFNNYKDVDFVGIGSILDERINKGKNKKIIFGAGIRDLIFSPRGNFDVRFVRGPLSSKVFGNSNYITDSAYCLALLEKKYLNIKKQYDCSIIPYFRHRKIINWKLFEKITGIHVIFPDSDVEGVIEEIGKSEKIICGAMHGAIIADVLRVPWKRLRFGTHGSESYFTSEIKWHDWLYSMEIYSPIEVININRKLFEYSKTGNKISSLILFIDSIKKIRNNNNFYLSNEIVFKEKIELLAIEIEKFKIDYETR